MAKPERPNLHMETSHDNSFWAKNQTLDTSDMEGCWLRVTETQKVDITVVEVDLPHG
jgi:hypothetical protein